MYCIKNKLKKAEEVLSLVEDYLSFHKDDSKVRLEYLLLLIASETEENCKKAWILLREIISASPEDVKNLVLASFLFNDCLKNESLGEKYQMLAERTQLKKNGWVPEDGKHQEGPI